MKKPLIIGNWKMNKTNTEAKAYFDEFKQLVPGASKWVGIGVPFTCIQLANKYRNFATCAQNLHHEEKGTHTGEISAEILVDLKVKYVLVGHSERRAAGEPDAEIAKKLKLALTHGITPVLCVGETRAEREAGETKAVISKQIEGALEGMEKVKGVIVAYEPVWAISDGSGSSPTASEEQIQEAHTLIKKLVSKRLSSPKILFGGSVNEKNATSLAQIQNVHGFLVGGASLDAKRFALLCNSFNA